MTGTVSGLETVLENCKHDDCKYRGRFALQPCCLYMFVTSEPRRSKISECDKYDPGEVCYQSTLGGFWSDEIR